VAAGRELKNKIRSIKNTKKITRTMEMISTAKSRVCQKRAEAVKPYGDQLAAMLRDLGRSAPGGDRSAEFPLLRRPEKNAREAIIVITANRGLCGGYNTNVLKLAEKRIDRLVAAGTEVETYMIGKKGAARFRYAKRPVAAALTNFDDKPTYEQAEELIQPLLDRYSKGELDAVTVVLTRYESAARQTPGERELLPLADPAAAATEEAKSGKGASPEKGAPRVREFILEPDAATILGRLLPVSLKTRLFQSLVEAAVCEQIARRVAMKNATDNAEEMVKSYTQLYNRTRQANITQEILEVIGGAQK
jgi:F-type H+-transporting ATPase subunit gamma